MIDVAHEISSVDRRIGSRTLPAGEARALTISRVYDTTPEDLWDACTNPERLPRWFLPVSGDLRPGGRYAVSVHHYSVEKQRAGWIKEGKPGQADVDYIYRFSRDELQALFPGCRVRAVGFYGWPMQSAITAVAGAWLARRGHGHMIIGYGVRRA